MKQIKTLMSLGLMAASILTACGKPTPLSTYTPNAPLPAATTVVSAALPQVLVTNTQPTLPDGKKATDIRFDMEYQSANDTSKTPTPKASPVAGTAVTSAECRGIWPGK